MANRQHVCIGQWPSPVYAAQVAAVANCCESPRENSCPFQTPQWSQKSSEIGHISAYFCIGKT